MLAKNTEGIKSMKVCVVANAIMKKSPILRAQNPTLENKGLFNLLPLINDKKRKI